MRREQGPPKVGLVLVTYCLCRPGLAASSSNCLGSGSRQNRSEIVLKIARHDWLSHNIVSSITEIVLGEILGYSVEQVRPASQMTWGADITAGLYDIDVEQWNADHTGQQHRRYVATEKTVMDVGFIGYAGKAGLYTMRAMVDKDPLADYYKFYQNGTTATELGFQSFRNSRLRSMVDAECCCNLSWCGTGDFQGYWAPPKCRASPEDCFEILKPSVTADEGYFEQMVQQNSVMGVFGYYGWGLEDHLRSMQGEPAVFYWWEPTLLILQLDAVRISFPDHYFGCDRNNAKDPDTGNVACDHQEVHLRKLASQRLRDVAPAAYYFLYHSNLGPNQIRSFMLATAGNRSIEAVACSHVLEQTALAFLPTCIVDPVSLDQGDGTRITERFNAETLECENITELPQVPPYICFQESERPGQVDRSNQAIYLSHKDWLSHNLATTVAEIVLREYMGLNVINVFNPRASAFFGEQMSVELYDIDMENWHVKEANRRYLDSGLVHLAGSTGYPGRVGLYVGTEAVEESNVADYYKFYLNATHAAGKGFATHSETTLREVSGSSFPACVEHAWCGTGELEGYWASPKCEGNPSGCLEVVLGPPTWLTGHTEQLVNNWGLEVVIAYYGGSSKIKEAVAGYDAKGLFIPFVGWEPDAWLSQAAATRISFPDYSFGCLRNDTFEPSGPVTCDFPPTALSKLVTKRVVDSSKAALSVIESIEILLEDMTSMLSLHTDAGGNLDVAGDVACQFIKSNEAKVRTWAPDCLVRPPPPEEVRINDTWFSEVEGACIHLSCPADRILTWVEVLESFECIPCRAGEVPDEMQLSCSPCAAGQEAILDDGFLECRFCSAGKYSLPQDSECSLCGVGSYAEEQGASSCDTCPVGRAQNALGSTECEQCEAGHFASVAGQAMCDPCSAGDFKPNQTAPHRCMPCDVGKFTVQTGSSECEDCAFGTTQLLGADSPSFCGCFAGQFLLQLEEQEPRCLDCNKYMEPCEAGSTRPAHQLAGYSVSADGQNVHRCASEEACPQGPLGTCGPGSSGPGCADCEDGKYVWNGERCVECRPGTGVLALSAPLLVILVVFATHWYGNDPISYSFSSLSEFMVVVGLSATILFYLNSFAGFDVEWEEPVRTVMRTSTIISRELTGFNIKCSTSFSFLTNYVAMSLIPLIVASVFCALACTRWAVPKKLFNTYATITYAVFLLLVLHALAPFRYIVHPIGGGKSLLSMPNVFEGSDEHYTMVACAVCVMLLYCVPFLTVCVYATYKVGMCRHSFHRRWYLVCFRFLFYKFQPEAYYWGVCVLLRNTVFGLMPSVAPDNPKIGLFALSMVAALSITHTAMIRPWRFQWMTNFDLGMLCYVLLVVNLASGWVRESRDADTVVANLLVTLGMITGVAVVVFAGSLLTKLLCSSKEKLAELRRTGLEAEEDYQNTLLKLIDEANREVHAEVAAVLDQLNQLQTSSKKANVGDVPKPLRVVAKEHVDLEHIVGIAASVRVEDYNLQHFFEDCMHTFPELRLYNMQEFRDELEKRGRRISFHGVLPHRKLPPIATSHLNTGGRSGAEEQLRTVGALFAVYALCRQDMDGKEFLSFGVDEVHAYKVLAPPADVTAEDLKGSTWFKMTPAQRRSNFFLNFDWDLMTNLLEQAGIATKSDGKRLQLDVASDGRLVAMLSLTAIHDIMKDPSLCPTVVDEPYHGIQVGEQIHDHDVALSYILDRHPDVLPSFRVLTDEQQRVIRFTQSEMGFNAGWLVQAEGPPSIVLVSLKKAIASGGARKEDVAFYFVHWVTDLAGAEPTPFTGSEKFAVKFPPFVLQGLLQCFSVVEDLATKSETQVYEDYLRRRWHEFALREGDLPTRIDGDDAIAKMRLVCMSQGGARVVLDAFDKLNTRDRLTLVSELSESGLLGQNYSGLHATVAPEPGTPFLLYYSPAWCQRTGQTHPDLTLRTLAEVFRQARYAYPESRDAAADAEKGIVCRTIQVGVLKTTDLDSLANCDNLADMFAIERNSGLEGTLEVTTLMEV
mmetsp:Transcript_34583/g.79061  ORF Transcript_34583/g.79061 Transcript_34583/m.79061 type:complete len:2005 (-) Transcript_34583:238-6252(-)